MNRRQTTILICVLLALVTLGAFWRVLGCGFVDFDDDVYITANRWVQAGFTGPSVKWALTTAYQSTWQPMVWLSYMADHAVYGLDPFGYHLTNLLLHIASVVLLFLVLARMTGSVWKSAFVAALFAVHPLRVESVAWVAERKDVLSGVFWMLSMGAYVLYTERLGWKRYVWVFLFMALGLMAKPMLVTLPFVLLLLDYWPLGRLTRGRGFGRLVLEKIPLFCLSAASVVVASIAQMTSGALMTIDKLPAGVRLANATFSYVSYLLKMVWPAKLSIFYPHPENTLPVWQVIGSAVILVCLTVIVLRYARKRPWLAVGWLWYLVAMLPMIGIIQTGRHGMADRFTYIPLIGIFIAAMWGAADLVGPVGRVRRVGPVLAAVVVLGLALGTWRQTGYWKDDLSLFRRAVDVTERNSVAESNLSGAYIEHGEYEKGIAHAWASIEIEPGPRAYNNIGAALVRMGRLDEAIPYYEKALELSPKYAESRHNLGYVLFVKRQYTEAAEQFRQAISRAPDNADSHYFLACSLDKLGETDEAIRHYRGALLIKPDYHLAHYNLGVILMGRGDFEGAVTEFQAAIRAKPDYAQAHHNLGQALDSLQRFDEAMRAYREAIRLRPNLAEAHNNLAIDLYEAGRYKEAWEEVRLARKYGIEPHPEFLKALAAKSK